MSEAAAEIFCVDCGYNLRGIASDRCPECGWTIDRNALARSRIPWTHRRDIGRWRAYWRTVWLGSRRVKDLALEINRPIDPRDTRPFALITALLIGVPFAIAALATVLIETQGISLRALAQFIPLAPNAGPRTDLAAPLMAGFMFWPTLPVCILLFVWGMIRSMRLWVGSRQTAPTLHRHGAALSQYATAPLVFAPIGLALLAAGAGMRQIDVPGNAILYNIAELLVLGAGASVIAGSVGWCWLNVLRLRRSTLHLSAGRTALTAAAMPMSWLLLATVTFGILPWVIGLLCLMVVSIR